jgi:hypothetical protein
VFGALEHGVFGATKLKVSMAQKLKIFASYGFPEPRNNSFAGDKQFVFVSFD